MKRFGPGLLVAAAFIGPGTIATASAAGANYGYALVWALLFSIVATCVLQEMAARLGLVTRAGLAQALRQSFSNVWLSRLVALLVLSAIGFGNAAYEAGNIAGAAMGLAALSDMDGRIWSLAVGLLAAALLATNRYKMLESVLVVLVGLMSVVFILTVVMVQPDWLAIGRSFISPQIPDGGALIVIALVGTTVVPYNLFLHASTVSEKWSADTPVDEALRQSRWDTGLSISLGGLITLAIMSTAASAFFQTGAEFSAATMAQQLEPLLGPVAGYCFGFGLLAAGLTSAIAAPLAAAYAVCGALNKPTRMDGALFRGVWSAILVTGTLFAVLGTKPLAAILFAQAANGFLLPIVAVFLLVVMNKKALLGDNTNGLLANLLGLTVVILVSCLGVYKLVSLL